MDRRLPRPFRPDVMAERRKVVRKEERFESHLVDRKGCGGTGGGHKGGIRLWHKGQDNI